jgi:hypothetical protein
LVSSFIIAPSKTNWRLVNDHRPPDFLYQKETLV